MHTLKGFLAFPPLVNNVPNKIAKYGEVSSNSLTYAKDKTIHTSSAAPQTAFISFYSIKDAVTYEVPDSVAENVLKLGQFLYNRSMAGTMPSNGTVLNQQINAEFAATLKNFTCGTIDTNGSNLFPEWVTFEDTTTSEPTEVTLWLSDESFSSQYPEYEIEVIVPITPLDDFFKDTTQVKALLGNYNLVNKMAEVQSKRGEYPYTFLQALSYDYVNPRDRNDKTKSYWLVIIYGQAGNNPDLIRQKIVDQVLGNSTHTQDEWVTILPDLFKTTELIFTPLFNQYALGERDYQAGIYSPVVSPAKTLAMLKKSTKGSKYTDSWITGNYETSAVTYKSLAFGVVGNQDNRDGLTHFSEMFPDYILVSNNSQDLNRVSTRTQEFIVQLNKLIVVAETFTQFSAVPVGMARVIRDGIVYISAYYDNINILVASKPSVEIL